MKFLWLLLLTLPIHSALGADLPLPDKPHVVVQGYGFVEQIPDQVNIQFEVVATAQSLPMAKKEVDAIVVKAMQAALAQKVSEDNINASKIQASPQYEWRNQNREYKGERVSRQVKIKLTDASRYNALVDGLLAAGISRMQSPQLDFSQRTTLEKRALTQALDHAKQQAQTIAEHLGSSLDGVFQIAPVTYNPVATRMALSAEAGNGKQKAGLKLGKQKLEQRVRVVFFLKN